MREELATLEAVRGAEHIHTAAVLDESVRPADAFDRGGAVESLGDAQADYLLEQFSVADAYLARPDARPGTCTA